MPKTLLVSFALVVPEDSVLLVEDNARRLVERVLRSANSLRPDADHKIENVRVLPAGGNSLVLREPLTRTREDAT